MRQTKTKHADGFVPLGESNAWFQMTAEQAVQFFIAEPTTPPDDDTLPGADWSADDVNRFMADVDRNAAMRRNTREQEWSAAIADYRAGSRDTLRLLYERESWPPEGVCRLLAEALLETPAKVKNADKRKLTPSETARVVTIIDNMRAILPRMVPTDDREYSQFAKHVKDGVYEALAQRYGVKAETIRKKYPCHVKRG